MPTPVTFLQLEAVLRGVAAQGEILFDEISSLPEALWDAFPNPVAMATAILDAGSGLAGRVMAIPFSGLGEILQRYARVAKLGNKLIRGDDAIRWMFEGFTAFAQTITLTRNFGILVWLAQTAAVWLYRTFKTWTFLWQVAGVANEVELANLFIQKFARRIGTLRIAGLILGAFLVLAFAGAQLLMIGIAVTLVDGSAAKLFLSQNSSRSVFRGAFSKRVNARRGPD